MFLVNLFSFDFADNFICFILDDDQRILLTGLDSTFDARAVKCILFCRKLCL